MDFVLLQINFQLFLCNACWKEVFLSENLLMRRVVVKVFIENWVSRLLLIQSKFYQCLKTKTSMKVLQVHYFITSRSLKEMSCYNEDKERAELSKHITHNSSALRWNWAIPNQTPANINTNRLVILMTIESLVFFWWLNKFQTEKQMKGRCYQNSNRVLSQQEQPKIINHQKLSCYDIRYQESHKIWKLGVSKLD